MIDVKNPTWIVSSPVKGTILNASPSRIAPDPTALGTRLRKGEHRAVQEILSHYGPGLLLFLRTMVRCHETAEDLLQEVLILSYTRRDQLAKPERLESWLFTMARHAALNELRRPRRKREELVDMQDLEDAAPPDSEPSARQKLHSKKSAQILNEALAGLDEKRRELVALRYYSGLNLREIGEVLRMPTGSVGTTLTRTLEHLKERLASKGLNAEDLL